MKIIQSHPTSNNNSKAVAYRFAEERMLYQFHTTIASFPTSISELRKKNNLFPKLKRRSFDMKLKPFVKTWPWLEIARIVSMKMGIDQLTRHEFGLFSVDSVYRSLDKHVASGLDDAIKHGVSAVYSYEDGAVETFKKAKELGMACVYDLPIAYWETGRKLMLEEAERLPLWAKTLGGGVQDSLKKLEKKTRELEMSDLVIVPSQFVMDSLPHWSLNKKIVIAPFGTPIVKTCEVLAEKKQKNLNKPLRIMFAGSMSQRKGLGDLFSAIKLLKSANVELVVLGSLQEPINFYKKELPYFNYEPGRPHNQVLELMSTCDIFCLPSIVEGRALVMQEAMSQGLPLIITPNTGGEDLIIEFETGFLVPIRSPEIIAEKINWFIENRDKIDRMGEMAKLHAQKYTWENYGKQIVKGINGIFD